MTNILLIPYVLAPLFFNSQNLLVEFVFLFAVLHLKIRLGSFLVQTFIQFSILSYLNVWNLILMVRPTDSFYL